MKRLYLDLEICNKCPKCVIKCAYAYHPENNGITNLREEGAFNAICRHCDNAPCIKACPNDSLKKDDKGVLFRKNYTCTGCHSCVMACPFGTIFVNDNPHKTSQCDLCIEILNASAEPQCVETCPYEALKFGDFDENPEEFKVSVGDRAIVRALPWKKPAPVRKK